MTLPASPERIAASASLIFASGNVCVMTGRGSNWPPMRKRRIWCQVWYILRPMTPYTVIPLKMISLAKSTGTSPSGIPSSCTRPPIRTAANAWCSADGTPDISHTTSAPSPPVSARTIFTTSSVAALIVTCAPIVAASARRLGFTSDAMTLVAPAARAMPTAKHPIGPQPTMKTVLPGISAVSTVWNALPIGSMIAPTSVGMFPPSSVSTLLAGITMYSANAPSRSTPMMRVFLQIWLFPVRHWRQWPQTIWPSAVTRWPARNPVTPSPTDSISPANSWPTTIGGLMRPWAHGFQSAMWRSVPHTPACRTAMRTSPGPGSGLGTDFTVKPGARFSLMIACIKKPGRGEWGVGCRASEYRAREPAIYLEHRAGNIAGPFGRQKCHGGGQLCGRAYAAHGRFRQALLDHLGPGFRELLDALGRNESRTHAVHRDAVLRDLVRQRLGEAEDAGSRRRGEDQAR